jgi:hypothetical protein
MLGSDAARGGAEEDGAEAAERNGRPNHSRIHSFTKLSFKNPFSSSHPFHPIATRMAEHEGFDAQQIAGSAESSSAHALLAEHALGSHLIIRPTINLFPLSNYSFGYKKRNKLKFLHLHRRVASHESLLNLILIIFPTQIQ